jgi:hypothetical protein
MLLASDADHNLFEMPFVARGRKTAANLVCKALPELQRPLLHYLLADQDPSGREHLLDHPQAQWKPEVQPDSMANHFSWEAVAGVARLAGRFHSSLMPALLNSTLT